MQSDRHEVSTGSKSPVEKSIDRVNRIHQQSNSRTYCSWDNKRKNYWYVDAEGNLQRCQYAELPVWAKAHPYMYTEKSIACPLPYTTDQ